VAVDVQLYVSVTRSALGLPPLEIATSPDYYVGTQFLGAAVQWDRQQIGSTWLDGMVTVSRHRQMVTEQIQVEILGPDLGGVQDRMEELIQAFIQDSFTLTVRSGNAVRSYACEAADYQNASWTTPRMAGAQGQLVLSVPRQPVELTGSF
jgi:hypothetical protein